MRCAISLKANGGCLAVDLKALFVKNLRDMIAEEGLNSLEFAKRIEVSQANVSKWINGIAYPEIHHIQKMMDTFEWNPEDLFGTKIKEAQPPVSLKKALSVVAKHWDDVEIKRKTKPKPPPLGE